MPWAGRLPTKVKLTAPPVADCHAVTSSGRAIPFVNTGTGSVAHRTVLPSLNWAFS